jgi:predicted NBD/HSP70 family sugar kinase
LIVDSKPISQDSTDPFEKTRLGFFESQYGLTALKLTYDDSSDVNQCEDWIIRHFAYAIVNVIALLDPDTIVFGGKMTSHIDNFLGKLLNSLSGLVTVTLKMYITPLGDDASLFGATRAVIESYKQVTWTTV